jgi:hypothetical protein
MVTLDDVWRSCGSPRVALLKLDVEGAEARALAGAEELLASCSPSLLLEVGDQGDLASLAEWFAVRGYREEAHDSFRPYNHVFERPSVAAQAGPSASP